MSDSTKWLCIAWAPYLRRSQVFAREMGCRLYLIHHLRFQTPAYAPFKYVLQTIHTILVLLRERPRVIHAANPPFVCGLVVAGYCLLSRTKYVLDHHTGAFHRIWRWALPVQKLLSRHAASNIVVNLHWANIVHTWGGHTTVLVDPFSDLPLGSPYAVKKGFNMVYVNTFAPDEPLSAVIDAAAQLPDIQFYITGDLQKASKNFLKELPPNVFYTGFLPDDQYIGLLRAGDAIMALSTWDYTLQEGGCEAISVGKPLVTSDWPYLREVFSEGAIYVPNTTEGIRKGIQEMRENGKTIHGKIPSLQLRKKKEWDVGLEQLKRIVMPKKSLKVESETP
jgi:glycosyltransferase involved in cell wall biosynthesis